MSLHSNVYLLTNGRKSVHLHNRLCHQNIKSVSPDSMGGHWVAVCRPEAFNDSFGILFVGDGYRAVMSIICRPKPMSQPGSSSTSSWSWKRVALSEQGETFQYVTVVMSTWIVMIDDPLLTRLDNGHIVRLGSTCTGWGLLT